MFKSSAASSQPNLFSNIYHQLPDRKVKRLDDKHSWENTFFREITSRIPEQVFAPMYSHTGRPSCSIRILVAMRILKEGQKWTDLQLFEACEYNILFWRALGINNIDDQLPSPATYYNFWQTVTNYEQQTGDNLLARTFEIVTKDQIIRYQVSGKAVRMDSKLVQSNIAKTTRLQLCLGVLIKFYKSLSGCQKAKLSTTQQEDLTQLTSQPPQQLTYGLTADEAKLQLKQLAKLIHALIVLYQGLSSDSYCVLKRLWDDHFELVDARSANLPSKESVSESGLLESPIDESPEAPTDESPEAPIDESPEAPIDESPEAPIDESPEAPIDESPEAPTDESPESPTDESPESPTDESPEAPTDESTEAPIDESPESSTDKSTEAPTDESTEAPTDESTEQTNEPSCVPVPKEKGLSGKTLQSPHDTDATHRIKMGSKKQTVTGYVVNVTETCVLGSQYAQQETAETGTPEAEAEKQKAVKSLNLVTDVEVKAATHSDDKFFQPGIEKTRAVLQDEIQLAFTDGAYNSQANQAFAKQEAKYFKWYITAMQGKAGNYEFEFDQNKQTYWVTDNRTGDRYLAELIKSGKYRITEPIANTQKSSYRYFAPHMIANYFRRKEIAKLPKWVRAARANVEATINQVFGDLNGNQTKYRGLFKHQTYALSRCLWTNFQRINAFIAQ